MDNFLKMYYRIIRRGICRASFKFCIGEISREKMEGGKKDETVFSAL
jgi:hypothetical protein